MDRERRALLARLRQLEREARALEPGARERRRLRTAIVDATERFLASLPERRAYNRVEDPGAGLLAAPIQEEGRPIEELLALWDREVIHPGSLPSSPGHLAYVPGGGLYTAALGDYLAAVSNKYAGISFSGPGAVRMENLLVRWVADLVGLPAGAAGHLASGGSLATLTAILAARDGHRLRAADFPQAVVYLSAQAHHCIAKALRLAGLAEAPVRVLPVDERFRLRPADLTAAIAADRAAGLRPWLVVGNAGTTDTGAVDPLPELAAIAREAGCWYHVDAAYGGFFLLTEQGRREMAGIEHADSVVLDPHKSLFLPWGTGIVVVRDGAALAEALTYTGHYLQDTHDAHAEASPADLSPELTKHFRGARMWLPLMLAGTRPFAAALEEKLLLARYARGRLAELGFTVGPEPQLSVITFRWLPPPSGDPAADLEAANRVNAAIQEGVQQDGRVLLSSTQIDGRFTLRLAALTFRAHRKTIDLALEVLAEQAARRGSAASP